MDISKIDRNFHVESTIDQPDIQWLDASKDPFVIYGAARTNPFARLPLDVATATSDGVRWLHTNTAGIRARFRTDSPYLAVHAKWKAQCLFSHMTRLGTGGFDLYVSEEGKQRFVNPPFIPWGEADTGFEALVSTGDGTMRDYVLNFPLYNDVDELYIGVKEDSRFEEPARYANEKPVVFYGSSITQGGCASRPGNCYQNMLSRKLNMDYLNLGFSGNGKGELPIADYMASLEMAAFVCDYDYNAPTVEYLNDTHYRLYEIIRAAHPTVPYIMISKPDLQTFNQETQGMNIRRREVIKDTYRKALENGDTNVYFIDGDTIFEGEERFACTVDGCHPNDLGFYRFYRTLLPVLKQALNK